MINTYHNPVFSTIRSAGATELCCPQCESQYLHEICTHVVERDIEDGDATSVTFINGEGIKIERKIGRRINLTRRSYILIYFYCEECPHLSVLAIKQHKGTTLLEWLDPSTGYEDLPIECADWLQGFMDGHNAEQNFSPDDLPPAEDYEFPPRSETT